MLAPEEIRSVKDVAGRGFKSQFGIKKSSQTGVRRHNNDDREKISKNRNRKAVRFRTLLALDAG